MTPYYLRIPNDHNYWNVFRERVKAVAAEVSRIFAVETDTPPPQEIPWPYGVDERTGLYKCYRNFILVKVDGAWQEYELTPIVYDTLDANHEVIARKIGELLNLKEPVAVQTPPARIANPIGEPMHGVPGYFWPAPGDNWPFFETFTAPDGTIYYKGMSLRGPYWIRLPRRTN